MTKKQLSWRIIELKKETDAIIGSIFYAKHLEEHYSKKQLETVVKTLEGSDNYEFFGNLGFDCCLRYHEIKSNKYYYFPVYRDGIIGTGRAL